LLQSVQLHSLMKSGRFWVSMRIWPQRHENFSMPMSYQGSRSPDSGQSFPTIPRHCCFGPVGDQALDFDH
jgi:hypothetical protein